MLSLAPASSSATPATWNTGASRSASTRPGTGSSKCKCRARSADAATSERASKNTRMNALEGNLKKMQYKIDQSLVSVDEKVEVVKVARAGPRSSVPFRQFGFFGIREN
ncbi:hypothetical protein L227DRAFT_158532 [Lentinus tigrinus ALCF2SS1-6]|uniref:Uncharacterized protein n=1 Tax=Lentinus tigrinus ALCF2SS1-6 TaxID=1328759 RepID=A0A5C2S8F1_9APHY|nr:hypothetical protein L227DRAFT_158532 [Lentinus tigrinus ALCF2SS1-6]